MQSNEAEEMMDDTQEGEDQDSQTDWEAKARELEGKLKRVTTKLQKQKETPVKEPAIADERLDKIELRQLDPSLTPEQISEVLTIKKAKGYGDASEALNDPMVKAYLSTLRAEQATEQKINSAIPRPSTKSASSVPPPKTTINKVGSDWVNTVPKGSTNEELGSYLSERFGLGG